jgi:AcrR family transcriptional regulator
LDAATRLLIDNRGHFEIDQLATAAGCSTGAIYHNFRSKAGVLAAVVGRYNEALGALIPPEEMPESRHLWLAALRKTVEAIVTSMWNDPLTPVIVQETIKEASASAETERWLRLHVEALARHLAQAQAAGHVLSDRDVEVLAAGLAGGMRQIMRVFVARSDPLAIATVSRETWEFVARLVDENDPSRMVAAAKLP